MAYLQAETWNQNPVNQNPVNQKPVNQNPVNQNPVNQNPVNQKPVNKDDFRYEPPSWNEDIIYNKVRQPTTCTSVFCL